MQGPSRSLPDRGAPSSGSGAGRGAWRSRSSSRFSSKYGILPGVEPEPEELPGSLPRSLRGPTGTGGLSHFHHHVCMEGSPGGSTPQNRPGTPPKAPGAPGGARPRRELGDRRFSAGKTALARARSVAEGRRRSRWNRLGEAQTVVRGPKGWLGQRASHGRKTGRRSSESSPNAYLFRAGGALWLFPPSLL